MLADSTSYTGSTINKTANTVASIQIYRVETQPTAKQSVARNTVQFSTAQSPNYISVLLYQNSFLPATTKPESV